MGLRSAVGSAASWCSAAGGGAVHYLFRTKNSVLQGVYLAIISGAYAAIVANIYPRLPLEPFLPAYHRWVGVGMMCLALGSWAAVTLTSPGVIDAATLPSYLANGSYYRCDGVLYEANRTCKTTGLPKLARSKYCVVSGCNIARFDHYCPWVRTAVGERNYRVFVVFLAIHVAVLSYAAACMASGLASVTVELGLWQSTFITDDGSEVPASWTVVAVFLASHEAPMVAVLILTGTLAPVLLCFLALHCYLIARGTTTNGARPRARVECSPCFVLSFYSSFPCVLVW